MPETDTTQSTANAGIRGPLLLPALHLAIAPLVSAAILVVYLMIMKDFYRDLAEDPASLRWINLFETLAPIISVVFAVLVGNHFFNKRRATAPMYIGYLVFDLAVHVIRWIWVTAAIGAAAQEADKLAALRWWLLSPVVYAAVVLALVGAVLGLSKAAKTVFTDNDAKNRTERWLSFGYALEVQLFAVISIICLLNVMLYSQVRESENPQFRDLLHYDLTQTRRYTLSNLTKKVLGDLEQEYELVTLINPYDPIENPNLADYARQTVDLVDEYARRSAKVSARHVNPSLEPAKVQAVYDEITQRFAEQLQPVTEAADAGVKALEQFGDVSKQLAEKLGTIAENPALKRQDVRRNLENLSTALEDILGQRSEFGAVLAETRQQLDAALPNYDGARSSAENALTLAEQSMAGVKKLLEQQGDDESIAGAVRNGLLEAAQIAERIRGNLANALEQVRGVEGSDAYNDVRETLLYPLPVGHVLVMTPQHVRALVMVDMYVRDDSPAEDGGPTGEVTSLAESQITGAVTHMHMLATGRRLPMVVFVPMGRAPVFGPRGDPMSQYTLVRQYLEDARVRVETWSSAMRPDPTGQRMMPPGPPPKAEPGQQTIWVLVPRSPREGPAQPMAGGGEQAVQHIRQQLEQGDSAMLIAGPNTGFNFGGDPVAELLREYGINAKLNSALFRRVQVDEDRSVAVERNLVSRYKGDVNITKALAGLPSMFPWSSPMVETEDKPDDVTLTPLIVVDEQGVWAESNLMEDPESYRPDPGEGGDSFIIAMLVERGDTRLAVFTDPLWASDWVANAGQRNIFTGQVNRAFPGNPKLFEKTTYWLAGLAQLIAAGARSQEVRAVDEISPEGMTAIRLGLLLGMPAAALCFGIGVWLVRRRG